MDRYDMMTRVANTLYKVSPSTMYKLQNKSAPIVERINTRDPSKVGAPKTVRLELSLICNLRCPFCWWWGKKGIVFDLLKTRDPLVTQELSTEEVLNVIDQTSKYKPTYYLSGGEPFIRKDTIDIIEYINKLGLRVALTSNGTLLDENTIERLSKMDHMRITFSLDGPRDIHDSIRGKGNFDKTTNVISKLAEYKGKSAFPMITTNTVLSPWLIGRTMEHAKALQDTGTDLMVYMHLWFIDKEHAEMHKQMMKRIFNTDEKGVDAHIIDLPSFEDATKLADEVMELQKTRFKVPLIIRPSLTKEQLVKYYTDYNFVRIKKCAVPWDSFIVKANGDTIFCPDQWISNYVLGNVRNQSVDSLWWGEKAKVFRESLSKAGLFAGCNRCCMINTV